MTEFPDLTREIENLPNVKKAKFTRDDEIDTLGVTVSIPITISYQRPVSSSTNEHVARLLADTVNEHVNRINRIIDKGVNIDADVEPVLVNDEYGETYTVPRDNHAFTEIVAEQYEWDPYGWNHPNVYENLNDGSVWLTWYSIFGKRYVQARGWRVQWKVKRRE